MKATLTLIGALALGACGYFSKAAEAAPDTAPVAGEEMAVGPGAEDAMKMPTAQEAANAAASAQAAAEAGVVYAGYDKKGGAVTLKPGETLRIELKSIPTAGYVWTLVEAPAFMTAAGESTRGTDPANQNQPGFTGGNHYLGFDFVAKSAGTGTFRLTEGRPWETDEPPTDTYTLTVTVTPAP